MMYSTKLMCCFDCMYSYGVCFYSFNQTDHTTYYISTLHPFTVILSSCIYIFFLFCFFYYIFFCQLPLCLSVYVTGTGLFFIGIRIVRHISSITFLHSHWWQFATGQLSSFPLMTLSLSGFLLCVCVYVCECVRLFVWFHFDHNCVLALIKLLIIDRTVAVMGA